jgi:hypothetical protein
VVLVVHDADGQVQVVVLELLERPGQRRRRAGVVGAVEDHQRVGAHDLHAPRPVGLAEPARDGVLVDGCDLPGERRRDSRVDRLVLADRGDASLDGPVGTRQPHRRLRVVRPAAVHRLDVRVLAVSDRHYVARDRLDGLQPLAGHPRHERAVVRGDVGLVVSDLLDRVADQVGVLQRDAGHGARDRVDDARRVEPPADADLQHRDVGVLPVELPERQGRHHLEERRRVAGGRAFVDVAPNLLQERRDG